jgi:hypothetical protein
MKVGRAAVASDDTTMQRPAAQAQQPCFVRLDTLRLGWNRREDLPDVRYWNIGWLGGAQRLCLRRVAVAAA